MKELIIAPSLLAADKNHLPKEIKLAENAGAKYIHIDVMDNRFVPNLHFYSGEVKEICESTSVVKDVHIMVENPLKDALNFIKLGADIITFHLEACKSFEEVMDVINLIRMHGKKVGISIKPKTPSNEIYKFAKFIDLILVMTVEPGFGNQKFMEDVAYKIKELDTYRKQNSLNFLIEVDGGINKETAKICADYGADILVAGSYLYGHDDFKERLKGLINGN